MTSRRRRVVSCCALAGCAACSAGFGRRVAVDGLIRPRLVVAVTVGHSEAGRARGLSMAYLGEDDRERGTGGTEWLACKDDDGFDVADMSCSSMGQGGGWNRVSAASAAGMPRGKTQLSSYSDVDDLVSIDSPSNHRDEADNSSSYSRIEQVEQARLGARRRLEQRTGD
ncbi:hypothetical protein THAOC_05059 [Thalassiosira oceanica]|uniref:Uncharacterized protein n=1 Tax=Thalassiosira oceanica TaxID=159749 RepID=K0THW9_THAOC|nr:hypothetical protein THAOC_05059 [Thalassiosira oceanica]|eukprot:EJK73321.1 hypothetical protein THAOC_05059 [Thalassiosira oceanica]